MGSEFEQNITALTQLYGNATVAQQKFLAFEQMSATTPLGMQAIQSAATRLKTVGIEAEKTFNVMVDGKKIKANTYYYLKHGKLTIAKGDN